MPSRDILLFSTLNPYPFWAGSENLWYDLLQWKGATELKFEVLLADSPVTRKKAESLISNNISVSFYPHHNVNFIQRNLSRVKDSLLKTADKTLPWYDAISKKKPGLVFFNVAALADLAELSYATKLCNKHSIPYWLLLQHGYEDFFVSDAQELEKLQSVVKGAKRFVFISKKNRVALERALGEKLTNASHTVNAIPDQKIRKAKELADQKAISISGTAHFFNLGRFSPRDKAQHLLLEALSADAWKNRDWQLCFIGVSGFGKQSLLSLIQFYKLDPSKIRIIDHTEDVLEAITDQDVLLMPSLSEGTPFAMVEAMACGRPALGTPVGGIPELIIDGERGWLADNISAEAVAEKLEQCWQERKNWASYGSNAQKFVSVTYNSENSFPELISWLKNDLSS